VCNHYSSNINVAFKEFFCFTSIQLIGLLFIPWRTTKTDRGRVSGEGGDFRAKISDFQRREEGIRV